MVINYCGDKCFKIQSGKLSIISDPQPRFKGDITLWMTPPQENEWPPMEGQVYGPGEYEISEVEISGYPTKGGNATYVATVEDIRLCFIGAASENLEPGFLEKLGSVDILFAPAGISAKVIKQIQPKIVIPFYKKPDQLKAFLKEVDKKSETLDKLVLKKKDIGAGTKFVILKP